MKVLLTAFRNTSSENLIYYSIADTLIIENDKAMCAAQIENAVKQDKYNFIFCFGQRPNIKDKVHIETQARIGDSILKTAFDCDTLRHLFEQKGITAKLSQNAGTSYCNHLYYSGLNAAQGKPVQLVFIHIPYEKNISDFDIFSENFNNAIKDLFSQSLLEGNLPVTHLRISKISLMLKKSYIGEMLTEDKLPVRHV